MNTHLFKVYFVLISLLPLISCTQAAGQKKSGISPGDIAFKEYWYAGKAELTRYALEQARYGEIHKGDAVLIFVTEDFDKNNQVKHEGGEKKNVTSVLKLNFTKKFFTGLYPYSMMASVFTPVNNQSTLKVTTSSQEWCGHTFTQLNLRKNQYKGQLRSYFQSEGDQDFTLKKVLLEDEVWTKIRLNPKSLPTGKITLIPGSMFLRLKHRDYQTEDAIASLETISDPELSDEALMKYTIQYAAFDRVLSIIYEPAFPHAIVAWEEQTSRGSDVLTTRAVRTHTMNSAYWGQNDLADAKLREQLGLDLSNY